MTKNYVTEQKMLPPSQGPFPSLPPSFLAIPLNRITFLVLTLLSVHFYDKKGIFLIRPFKEEITVYSFWYKRYKKRMDVIVKKAWKLHFIVN